MAPSGPLSTSPPLPSPSCRSPLAGALQAEQDRDMDACDELSRGSDHEALWRTITARTERYLAEIAHVGIEAKARGRAIFRPE